MDEQTNTVPSFRVSTILLVALSLALGWGIRGNFGHETGAMVPGALAAIAVCLLSGRKDWRRRVAFFGFFGAVGWAFGGSMSYGQVIGYTHSGHAPSQLWGFAGLFVIGFLWAAMGGAGTALPAVADRKWLTGLFRPICWVFAILFILLIFSQWAFEQLLERYTDNLGRHESPLYWFDADWLQAFGALMALFLFDLCDRRLKDAAPLAIFAVAGAVGGWLLQAVLGWLGWLKPLVGLVVRYEGDIVMFAKQELLINWPQFFQDIPGHIGWMVGLVAGICLYFARYGRFRHGASLFVHMAAGWLIAFLALPTLGGWWIAGALAGALVYALFLRDRYSRAALPVLMVAGALIVLVFHPSLPGIRMTPPRADDWAGILGLFCGATIYFMRNGLQSVAFASIVSGFIGGLGFSGVQCLKLVMIAPGNPARVSDPEMIDFWQHWHRANWHSWLEQSYGFVNGLAIAVAIGLLATRVQKRAQEVPVRPWTEIFSIAFVLFALTYLNLYKCVGTWVGQGAVPELMKMPLIESIEMSALWWFTIIYLMIGAACTVLMVVHTRRRLDVVPRTWLGKGQLFYLVFLWIMVVGNFTRALTRFGEQRILTEGNIFVMGVVVTLMVLFCPRKNEDDAVPVSVERDWSPLIKRAVYVSLAGAIVAILAEFGIARGLYGDAHAGHAGVNLRFGPDATWRTSPIRHGEEHL